MKLQIMVDSHKRVVAEAYPRALTDNSVTFRPKRDVGVPIDPALAQSFQMHAPESAIQSVAVMA